jgi:hypothetical protein
MTITATPKLDAACNVRHKIIDIDGVTIFYREAGPARAPVLLLPQAIPHHLSSIDISCRCL